MFGYENNAEKPASEAKEKHVPGVLSVFWLVLLILYALAVLSYDPADHVILDGGAEEVGMLHNWIGSIGAHVARVMIFTFGLAVYPIGILVFFSAIRNFLPFPLKRKGYAAALLSVILSLSVFFAMAPQRFMIETENLGLAGIGLCPEMGLSGGLLGAALAAPPVNSFGIHLDEGFLCRHIGEGGTLILALALFFSGLFLLFSQDWYPLILEYLRSRGQIREKPKVNPEISSGGQAEPPPEKRSAAEPDGAKSGASAFAAKLRKFLIPDPEEQKQSEAKSLSPEEKDGGDARQENESAKDMGTNDLPEEKPVAPPVRMTREETDGRVRLVIPGDEGYEDDMVLPPDAAKDGLDAGFMDRTPYPLPPDRKSPVRSGDEKDKTPVRQFSALKPDYDREKPADEGGDGTPHTPMFCPDYCLPPVSMLDKPDEIKTEDSNHIESSREKIQKTLESFNVEGHVSEIVVGPRVTRFEITLEPGVKVEKVTGIQGNIAMDLAAASIRILAPIPGKTAVGIEVPNKVSSIVYIRSLMESSVWKESHAQIPIILGRDIAGKVIVTDLSKAPHLLIAGSTGSGKSVCMNTLIMSLLFRFSPAELRLIMVDPKVVELEMYRPIPHLITPVVNDPKKVPLALRWGVNEMERRYKLMAKVKTKKLADFNSRPQDPVPVLDDDGNVIPQKLPMLIIIIDELADIMMTEAKGDVETSICRIAQKGRAAGIHLVIATQTPRKDVITGLIKANLPTKIAFKVGSNMDSRVILDTGGAEKLLGMGDMLFKPNGADGMERIQGSMVSDPEIQKIVDFVSAQVEQNFVAQVVEDNEQDHEAGDGDMEETAYAIPRSDHEDGGFDDDYDLSQDPEYESPASKYLKPGDSDLLRKALDIIIREQKVSTSYLQRRLGIGYNKSAELMDQLEERGIISAPLPGGQKREILITDGLEQND